MQIFFFISNEAICLLPKIVGQLYNKGYVCTALDIRKEMCLHVYWKALQLYLVQRSQ